jgi:hypothetical protein
MKNNGITIDRPIGWTTLEESKELRRLGLRKGTNDLWYIKPYYPEYIPPALRIEMSEKDKNKKIISPIMRSCFDIPAWSLGALLDVLPSWIVVYDKDGRCHDAFFKVMNGAAWYEFWDGEKSVSIWKTVESLTIIAVIGMVKFMLSHPDILETKTADL